MRFWDASAIVPLLVADDPRSALLTMLEQDPLMLVWWGSPVECASAMARREREGALPAADAARAFDRLRSLTDEWQEVLPTDALRATAQRLLRVHPLRAADALQLGGSDRGSRTRPILVRLRVPRRSARRGGTPRRDRAVH